MSLLIVVAVSVQCSAGRSASVLPSVHALRSLPHCSHGFASMNISVSLRQQDSPTLVLRRLNRLEAKGGHSRKIVTPVIAKIGGPQAVQSTPLSMKIILVLLFMLLVTPFAHKPSAKFFAD